MRKDIQINIDTKDIVFSPDGDRFFSGLEWLDGVPEGELQEYLYGEVTVSQKPERILLSEGIYVKVPYTPKYLPVKLRIRQPDSAGGYVYASNPANGSVWFDIKARISGAQPREVMASELILIHEDSYHLCFETYAVKAGSNTTPVPTGTLTVYSAFPSDFNIVRADTQNSNLLLACIPGNSYRYPLSGVGLIRWLNGNLSQSQVAQTIQDEFAEDGVVVRNASFDDGSQQLYLDANYDDLD